LHTKLKAVEIRLTFANKEKAHIETGRGRVGAGRKEPDRVLPGPDRQKKIFGMAKSKEADKPRSSEF